MARVKRADTDLFYDVAAAADGEAAAGEDSDSGLNVDLGASDTDSEGDPDEDAIGQRVPVTRGFGSPHLGASANNVNSGGAGPNAANVRQVTPTNRGSISMYVNVQAGTITKNSPPLSSANNRTTNPNNNHSSKGIITPGQHAPGSAAPTDVVELCDLPAPTCDEEDGDTIAKKLKKTKRKTKVTK